jgi:hypothetical protein
MKPVVLDLCCGFRRSPWRNMLILKAWVDPETQRKYRLGDVVSYYIGYAGKVPYAAKAMIENGIAEWVEK